MLLNDIKTLQGACKTLSALARTLEVEAATRELWETAIEWRDNADVLQSIWLLHTAGEEIILDEIHIDIVVDTLVNTVLQLPGLVECHLINVNKKSGEVCFLFGEDERLDFCLDKPTIAEMKELNVFRN